MVKEKSCFTCDHWRHYSNGAGRCSVYYSEGLFNGKENIYCNRYSWVDKIKQLIENKSW